MRRLFAWLREARAGIRYTDWLARRGELHNVELMVRNNLGGPMKIEVKRTDEGILLSGSWVDLAILATIIVDMAKTHSHHPRSGDVEDVGLAMLTALVGREPGDAPPAAVPS